jgi:hypothetical protein
MDNRAMLLPVPDLDLRHRGSAGGLMVLRISYLTLRLSGKTGFKTMLGYADSGRMYNEFVHVDWYPGTANAITLQPDRCCKCATVEKTSTPIDVLLKNNRVICFLLLLPLERFSLC